jgi:hypothetical protein
MQTLTICGGTLFGIACDYLDDATQWNRIAALNNTRDPWLNGVVVITLPDIDPGAGGGFGQ